MSSTINKVLADRPQAFTTAEQAQARANIGAMGSVDMSAYVPYSVISADAESAITSINGSSVGKFTGVSADSNMSGNGTSASPLGLNHTVTLTRPTSTLYSAYSAVLGFSNLQFGDDSGHSGTFNREGINIRKDGSDGASLNADGFSAYGSYTVSLSKTANALHPLGLLIKEANGAAGTAQMDSNQLNIVARGFRGSPLSSYSAHISELKPSALSFTYEKSDSSKESALLCESALRFSANDTSNTSYLPTASYGRGGAEFRYFDADIGHSTQTDVRYSGIHINASSNFYITDIGPSAIVMRNAWSPATHSAILDCYGARWTSTAGDWCYIEPRYIRFATGGENSSEYIDNAKVKSYDAVNKLMSSLSAWATAQGWTPT